MKRFLVVALLALAAALPAAADNGASTKGTIVSVSAAKIAVQDARGVVLTCKVGPRSPSVSGYAAGDSVGVACAGPRGRLVLVRLRHLDGGAQSDTKPVSFAGAVTAIDDSSVSLHDGDRDLTCTLGTTSPSLTGVAVGQHIKVTCANGVLTAWAPVAKVDGDGGHITRGALGTLAALTPTAVTVHTDGGDVTCTLGPSSPPAAGLAVGDRVKMGCVDGVVVALAKVDAPPPGDSHTQTAAGTISALSDGSLTVHGDHGDLTCARGASSPALGDYHVGDHVGIACVDGALAKIVRLS